ncbi:serine/threonine-protein kinase [Actinoplanes subtropicus]|uniref:serine/threonine-protein kinase n=1 Tax=Actinoplanes subtropicus TaxID=543632 RepID=UPI000AEBEDAD|nr:serine/threonine-protein kinase [Actinoplanes subtropicus]
MDGLHRVAPLRRSDPEWLGGYRLSGRLGSGGMGVVYLAADRYGDPVAIKLVHAVLADDPEFLGRFRSEVNRARQVPSFCTAEVLDADLDHHPPYLVVEFVDGPSLTEVVKEYGPLRPAALHSLAVGVATALTAIHGAGVIHRDLKPGNVLLAPGSPKVIDFGLARAFEATSQHTRTDQMVGTVSYMAPERFTAEPAVAPTPAADVFAWGCVVAYAGTGRTPFHGDSPSATAAKILTQPPHLAGLPEPLRGVVELALAKDPAERPTAREILDLLLGNRPMPAPMQEQSPADFFVPEPMPEEKRPVRRRILTAFAALLIVAGVATAALVGNARVRPSEAVLPGAGAAATASRAPVVKASPSPAADPAPADDGKPVPEEPHGGEPIIQDPLTRDDQWVDSQIQGENASCVVRGVMRVTRADQGTYQCIGPKESIEDDFGVAVTVALQSPGSCAAIWFHWVARRGGQVLRVCQTEFSVAADTPDDHRVYRRVPLARPIGLGRAARIHLVVRDGAAQVFRGGTFAGQVALPVRGPVAGQVLLGLSAETPGTGTPYAVTFAAADIRSL